ELDAELAQLIIAIRVNDVKNIKRILNKIIPEYNPAPETTDLLASETESQICANISRPEKVHHNGKNGKTVKSAELGVMGNGKSGSRTC
ncbi:MAG: polysaccharide biosynthesis protein, partial [Chlorobium sp.]|nr:polysaccharide biosynthesis protein [Chlorobium sp.]